MRNAILRNVLHIMLAVFAALVLAGTVLAQQQNDRKPASNLLVRVLQAKGILTDDEAAMVSQASTADEAEGRLARLLLSKGIITQADYDQTVGSAIVQASAGGATGARIVPAVLRLPASSPGNAAASPDAQGAAAQKPAGPAVIPAIPPIRVFPLDPPKREGVVPAFKLGPIAVRPYGFFKASVVYDSSQPRGDDFPLPGFNNDTGPKPAPEFRVKARAFRIGSNFEWLDPSPHVTVTARVEGDFEGNYERANNRNVSSIRSSQFGLRQAWARVDYAATDTTSIFALFGQDWSPFGSSTLPNLLETTGLGVAFGTLYERQPQARLGFTHNFGGSVNFKIQPEVAVVLPAFGNLPSDVANQLGFGERQGADSARPEIQGRLAFQWQLDPATGVAPAQIIFSGMQGRRRAIVLKAAVPAAFQAAFPNGVDVESSRWGGAAEIQLPTRYFTLLAKYYNGEDLRWFFAGQLTSTFNDTIGLTGTANATSIDGSSTVVFGNDANGNPMFAPQRPVRAQGGFVNLGIPLSRIAGADATGRNAGWSMYFHYGFDEAKARDLRHISTTASQRNKGDLGAVSLWYRLNNWVSFAVEQSYYRTRALPASATNTFTLATPFRGNPARSWHDNRTEFGTVFTF